MKKLIAIVLIIMLVFAVFPANAEVRATVNDDNTEQTENTETEEPKQAEEPEKTEEPEQTEEPEEAEQPEQTEEAAEEGEFVPGYIDIDFSAPKREKSEKKGFLKSNNFPASYTTPILPAIRNQLSLGLCWAFAIEGAAEIDMLNNHDEDDPINLAELQLAYYHHGGLENYSDPLGNWSGDYNWFRGSSMWDGDNYYLTSKTASSWIGPMEEDAVTQYSTKKAEAIKQNGLDDEYAQENDYAHIKNIKMINAVCTKSDIDDWDISYTEDLKQAITDYGSVAINYLVADDRDKFFGDNPTGIYYYCPLKGNNTNHAVLIVGWDDTISKENFLYDNVTPAGDGAWLVRNSWGAYGSNTSGGYFYMSYYSAPFYSTGGIDCFAYDCDYAEEDDRLYMYDGTSSPANLYFNSGESEYQAYASGSETRYKVTAANMFEAKDDEAIKEVSFWLDYETDMNYKVMVYGGCTEGNPQSGRLLSQKTGTTDFAGYYTVELNNEVYLKKGDWFSVVIEYDTPNTDICLSFDPEGTDTTIGWMYFVSEADEGQSFIKDYVTGTGYVWRDLNDNKSGNLRITYDKKYLYSCNGGNLRIRATTVDNPEYCQLWVNGGELTWEDATDATGYEVYASSTEDGEYTLLTTLAANKTTYSPLGVSARSKWFKIVPIFSNGCGSWSNPKRLSSTTASIDGKAITWKDALNETGFEVYVSDTENGTYTLDKTLNANVLRYKPNVPSGETRWYKVVAIFSNGSGGFSNAVRYVYADMKATDREITWPNVADETGYKLYSCSTGGGEYTLEATLAADTVKYTPSTESGEFRWYKIVPTFSDGEGCMSDTLRYIYCALELNERTLSWEAVNGAEGYSISSCATPDGTYTPKVTLTNSTTYKITGGVSGQTTWYKMMPIFKDGMGCRSDAVRFVFCELTASGRTLSWDDATGETGYELYESSVKEGIYTLAKTFDADVTSYTFEDSASEPKWYKIVPVFSDGKGCKSSAVRFVYCELKVDGGKLSWESAASATSYKLYSSDAADGTYTLVTTLKAGTTEYQVDISTATPKWYKVAPIIEGTVGCRSNAVKVNVCKVSLTLPAGIDANTDTAHIWLNGNEYPAVRSGNTVTYKGFTTSFSDAMLYAYNGETEMYKKYPTHMYVWLLGKPNAQGECVATYVPEFTDLLTYKGSQIRILPNKGFRIITQMDKTKRDSLMGTGGLAGYTVLEYGTVFSYLDKFENGEWKVTEGATNTVSAYAYSNGNGKTPMNMVYKKGTNFVQYTNNATGYTIEQCQRTIISRPYIVLKNNATGEKITLHGAALLRSIYYVAKSLLNTTSLNKAQREYCQQIVDYFDGE